MPRLFEEPDSIPGLTRPTLTFSDTLSIELGGTRGKLELAYCGRGHTEGDIVAWLPSARVLFAGDLVEAKAALYTGDAFHRDWHGATLDRVRSFGATTVVGGRGDVARGDGVLAAIEQTRGFLRGMLDTVTAVRARRGTVREAFEATRELLHPQFGKWPIFEHCLPFNVSRLWDELDGIERPRIWTAERDREVWSQLRDG
jgi:glyoxylase-like metal-dependent hydrolase (beta-lactamase superfamily II)